MIKKLSLLFASLALSVAFLQLSAAPASALFENAIDEACAGSQVSASAPGCTAPAQSRLNTILQTAINIFSVVVGIAAVIMIMVSGIRYITSGGDSGAVSNAKNTLLYAVIGLIIVALAQFIVKFVLNKATK